MLKRHITIIVVLLFIFSLKLYSNEINFIEIEPTYENIDTELPNETENNDDDFLEDDVKEKDPKRCEECQTTESDFTLNAIQDIQDEIFELKEIITELEEGQEDLEYMIQDVASAPGEDFLVDSNFVPTGTGFARFRALDHRNSTFDVFVDPVFLWRYKDRFLFEMKLDIALRDCDTDVELVYGVIDYVINNCWIVRAGKFSLPLGLVYEKMTTGWINKLPNLPLPYEPRSRALLPAADVGVNFRGAIPIGIHCTKGRVPIPVVFSYDFWIGNGPDEDDGKLRFSCNYKDNNHNLALGGRFGFRFWPYREVGFSWMYGQWNNNKHGGTVTSKKPRYYGALVIDANWRIDKYSKFMGELIWTRRGVKFNPSNGVCYHVQYEKGLWLQYSSYLGMYQCPWWMENVEVVFRYGQVWSDIRKASRQQYTFGVNYHFNNRLIFKTSYDFNSGVDNKYNSFWLQLAYAY